MQLSNLKNFVGAKPFIPEEVKAAELASVAGTSTGESLPLRLGPIGTLPSGRVFDSKIAGQTEFQFSSHKGSDQWKGKTERYMMSVVPAVHAIFAWAEKQEGPISQERYEEAVGKGLWRHIQPFASKLMPVKSVPRALLLGALWGWLPCGLVYSTLLWAASQGNATESALLMLAFGLGTWPVLLATGLAAERLMALLRKRGVRIAGGVTVILFGLWTLPGPHQQWLMGHGGATVESQPATQDHY